MKKSIILKFDESQINESANINIATCFKITRKERFKERKRIKIDKLRNINHNKQINYNNTLAT